MLWVDRKNFVGQPDLDSAYLARWSVSPAKLCIHRSRPCGYTALASQRGLVEFGASPTQPWLKLRTKSAVFRIKRCVYGMMVVVTSLQGDVASIFTSVQNGVNASPTGSLHSGHAHNFVRILAARKSEVGHGPDEPYSLTYILARESRFCRIRAV
ncbi:hypothetical protein RRG08_023320 [Elysia crispata]|uniref:Uncharacterized protein n=1 Tax=Elysia crispata TaxID=231223 RepID=A0AAE1BCH3_9GAST|nr:hypothetical protein RRG08_023320 [Elysia crispata]